MDHEYYSTVYTWFEKCGIISNIRTHLRQNLINALKNKDLTLKRDNAPKPAKQYVYDLLIAEYLFNSNYAYTLSVFASEAPLLINFHQRSFESPDNRERDNREKLQNDYILHTLETLGINPRSTKGQYIISHYVENDIPLLLCVLKCIAMFSFNAHSNSDDNEEISTRNRSTQTDFPERVRNMDAEKLTALRKKIHHEKQIIDSKLQEREMMLKEQAVAMEQQLLALNEKLEQIQNIMHLITEKEKELKERKQNDEQQILQKEMELTFKERLLVQEADRLEREQNQYKKFGEDLKELQEKFVKVQKQVPREEPRAVSMVRHVEVQTDVTYNTKEDELQTVLKEREELSNLVKEQQLNIEQITQRALQLSRQVEELRVKPTNEIPTQTINLNTIISESSSTEDILQDAKIRLKRLEEESLKADQYYYNFINTSP